MKRFLFFTLAIGIATAATATDFSNEITVENVIALMNEHRAERSLPPLHHDADLAKAAEDRMRDMEDGGWWSHVSPEGTSPFTWLRVRDHDFTFAGENLAVGFETARLLVSSWMESAGHRQNILGGQFSDCGIAIIEGSTKGPTNGKSVVVLFGTRQSGAAGFSQPRN
jgi:uncharacterized protein YkwD